jgi:uncharacterized iron-regulated membrane protein
MSQPLHFGDYGGLPLKALWALFDIITIAVLCSGLYCGLAGVAAAWMPGWPNCKAAA